MKAQEILTAELIKVTDNLFPGQNFSQQIQLQKTKKEFEGDLTLVVFPFSKASGKNPEETGKQIGEELLKNSTVVSAYNVVKGFLNLSISDACWTGTLAEIGKDRYGFHSPSGKMYLVEYSSPNTNKPLHLGHLRNIFLGYSLSEIFKACGHEVIKTQVINDRGIHICKSMLAWKMSGQNETPASTGLKGDKLVGKYYVEFDKKLREELKPVLDAIYKTGNLDLFSATEKETIQKHLEKLKGVEEAFSNEISAFDKTQANLFDEELKSSVLECLEKKSGFKDVAKKTEKIEKPDALQKDCIKKIKALASFEGKVNDIKGDIKELAQNKTEIMKAAQQLLLLWEKGDAETIALWKQMNGWVYDGFDVTYKKIGVDFDKLYYESDTYILGKDQVEDGLKKGVFFRKDDGSVWCDLKAEGLDEKIVLRSDGTSVYITQDIGTAILRYKDYPQVNGMTYTVGNEQEYHFKVLFQILKKLGYSWAHECYHLSYGMVDLPSGKMKSREGTVVDADDIIAEMEQEAENKTRELGKIDDVSENERQPLFQTLGLGALKYFILKVDPRKRMLFDPAESIDFQGNTGPFIQYTYARIQSLIRKSQLHDFPFDQNVKISDLEKEVIILLNDFPMIIQEAAKEYSPALIANYIYELVKAYNRFFQSEKILTQEDTNKKHLGLALSKSTGNVIKSGLALLGIGVPERM